MPSGAPRSTPPASEQPAGTLMSGALWSSLSQISVGAVSLISGVVAARTIDPTQFGIMAAVTLTIALLDTFTVSGFDEALVQKQGAVTDYLDAVWTWNVLRGLALAALLAGSGPLLARWYDEPNLTWVAAATALYPILVGLRNVGTVNLQRDLRFRRIFAMNLGQAAVGLLIYLPAVLVLRDVRALIAGQLSTALGGLLASYAADPHRPRLRFSRTRLLELARFGRWVTGMSVLGFAVTRGDDLFISKALGLGPLAHYQQAYGLANLPATHVTHVLARASFPAYSRLQGDVRAMVDAFVNVSRATVLISGPLAVAIGVAAPDLVRVVLGERWMPVAPLVRILVIAGFLRSFAALAGFYFYAAGRPELNFRMNVPRLVCTLVLLWPATRWFGIEGACWAIVAAIAATLPHWFSGMRGLAGLTLGQVLRHHRLAVGASALLAVVMLLTRRGFAEPATAATLAAWLVVAVPLWLALLAASGRLLGWSLLGEARRLRDGLQASRPGAPTEPAVSPASGP